MIVRVSPETAGERLDVFLASALDISRSASAKLICDGFVLVNGVSCDKKYTVKADDEISADLPEPKEIEALPQNIPIDIVYEDSDIVVINKAKGMVVHPAAGNPDGTLVNALLYHCKGSLSGINGDLRPGIVHRIDKDTSGLLVVAKNDTAHRGLAAQLEGHRIVREYHAIVNGGFKNENGTVNLPIDRNPKDRKKMAVSKGGREAITHYEVIERLGQYTYLRLYLETGRTHQIRVHMSHIGHPLFCDEVYGGGHTKLEKTYSKLLTGQCLHAKKLSFTHPITNQSVSFETPLPEYFEKILDILRTQK